MEQAKSNHQAFVQRVDLEVFKLEEERQLERLNGSLSAKILRVRETK